MSNGYCDRLPDAGAVPRPQKIAVLDPAEAGGDSVEKLRARIAELGKKCCEADGCEPCEEPE